MNCIEVTTKNKKILICCIGCKLTELIRDNHKICLMLSKLGVECSREIIRVRLLKGSPDFCLIFKNNDFEIIEDI